MILVHWCCVLPLWCGTTSMIRCHLRIVRSLFSSLRFLFVVCVSEFVALVEGEGDFASCCELWRVTYRKPVPLRFTKSFIGKHGNSPSYSSSLSFTPNNTICFSLLSCRSWNECSIICGVEPMISIHSLSMVGSHLHQLPLPHT